MNELADRLENLSQRIELAHVEQDSKTVICSLNDLNQEVWKSREVMFKALRFAGYMETLKSCGPEFALCVSGNYQIRVILHGKVRKFYGPDIYDAARKAVDALEKGD